MARIVVRTGGQTGVDRAAMRVARRLGLRLEGWCPRGGWAEDHEAPLDLRAAWPELVATPSVETAQRTCWNARDSHATLILRRGHRGGPGTELTRQAAELVFLRPCLTVDLADPAGLDRARAWLDRTVGGLGLDELVLNVAGPRESEDPGLQAAAEVFLGALLGG